MLRGEAVSFREIQRNVLYTATQQKVIMLRSAEGPTANMSEALFSLPCTMYSIVRCFGFGLSEILLITAPLVSKPPALVLVLTIKIHLLPTVTGHQGQYSMFSSLKV